MIVYSNSDSYGVMSTTKMRYSEFLANDINATVINNGKPGSCNTRIFRNTVRDLISLKSQHPDEQILCLICLGSLIRSEWWDETYVPEDTETDGQFRSFQIYSPGIKNPKIDKYCNEWFKLFNDEAEQTNLFFMLVLLTSWLKSNNIEYIIFSGNSITYKEFDYTDIFVKPFALTIYNDPGVLNFSKFSFVDYCLAKGHTPFDHDLWQNNGHHGEQAHRDFANYLLKIYNERRH